MERHGRRKDAWQGHGVEDEQWRFHASNLQRDQDGRQAGRHGFSRGFFGPTQDLGPGDGGGGCRRNGIRQWGALRDQELGGHAISDHVWHHGRSDQIVRWGGLVLSRPVVSLVLESPEGPRGPPLRRRSFPECQWSETVDACRDTTGGWDPNAHRAQLHPAGPKRAQENQDLDHGDWDRHQGHLTQSENQDHAPF